MDVVTWGETMVVLVPHKKGSLESISVFFKELAGSESNVAIGLSRLGYKVAWISRLGQDSFGRDIFKRLKGEGVDVSQVTFDESRRTGVFFKEFLGDGRTNAFYYREGSAASHFRREDVSLQKFGDVRFFLLTGITPALSTQNRSLVDQVLKEAKKNGTTVVFDPNIRHKLWHIDEARLALNTIASQSDIVLPGIDEGRLLTGMSTPEEIASAYIENGAKVVVVKLGAQGAYYQTQRENGYVDAFKVGVANDIGAGDAFTAGLLSGLLDNLGLLQAVKRACALGALAVTGIGDYDCLPDRTDLEVFLNGYTQPTR